MSAKPKYGTPEWQAEHDAAMERLRAELEAERSRRERDRDHHLALCWLAVRAEEVERYAGIDLPE